MAVNDRLRGAAEGDPELSPEPVINRDLTADSESQIFQFALAPATEAESLSLTEFYRQSILDLLRVVRFSFKGQPVLIDAFAFHHRSQQIIALIPSKPSDGGEG